MNNTRDNTDDEARLLTVVSNAPARVIAFYWPDFTAPEPQQVSHAWVTVAQAEGQFLGHLQPRTPHASIGFYSQAQPATIRAQAKMAIRHGIYGFCIHVRAPSELRRDHPLEVLRANADIDLPFCVSLGNPHRGREGVAEDVPPEQWLGREHSGFRRKLAEYIADPRFLRIDDKPIVVIAGNLASSEPAAAGLRRWAEKKGIGELHLSCVSPSVDLGTEIFDAVIDLPPDHDRAFELTPTYPGVPPEFAGRICDWRYLLEDSNKPDIENSCTRYLGVNPGWDNTPLAGESATVYVGTSPDLLQLWVDRAISRTTAAYRNESQRLLFVNSWNDWLHGAVLEPDEATGYANLLAVRNAVARQSMQMRVAVAIHAFYPEILPEILRRVRLMPPDTKLFVSCRAEDASSMRSQLEKTEREFRLYQVGNRGRDVAPFLTMLADIDAQHFALVAKVHTKKSPHYEGGEEWRAELFDAVLGLSTFNRALGAFVDDPSLGMVGPTQHFLPMTTYLEGNERHIFPHCSKLGLSEDEVRSQGFFAGTMFIARVAAIRRILELGLTIESFEAEAGQTNGTLAHGLERVFSVCVNASGFRLGGHWDPASEVQINFQHEFV